MSADTASAEEVAAASDDQPEADGPSAPDRPENGGPEPGDPSEASTGDGDPAEDAEELARASSERYGTVFNQFFGAVDASRSVFGFSVSEGHRRGGRLSAAHIARALQGFVPPDGFADAVTVLTDEQIVFLTGPRGIGKRTSALALLDRVLGEGDVTELSPVLPLGELADRRFGPGTGVLIQERAVEDDEPSARFDLGRLRAALGEAGAFLVVTQVQAAGRWMHDAENLVLPWTAPDPGDVLVGVLSATVGENDLVPLRAAVDELGPAEVRFVATRVLESGIDSASDALSVLAGTERHRLDAWFADEERAGTDVFELATVAFAYEMPEWWFEHLWCRLLTYALPPDEPPPWRVGARSSLPQRRRSRSGENAVVRSERRRTLLDESAPPERRVVLGGLQRGAVLEELHARYGFELWTPVGDWLREIVAESSWDTRFQAAAGLAILAGVAVDEVHTTFLDPWSRGLAAARVTTAWVLTWMCRDEPTAVLALRIATAWVETGTVRQKQTALTAFGLELGVRFPHEVLPHLWTGIRGSRALRAVARRSWAALFGASQADPDLGALVLKYLHKIVVHETGRGRPPRVAAAADATVIILACPASSGGTLVGDLLRVDGAPIDWAARCWAETLLLASFQIPAAEALLRAVSPVGPAERSDAQFAARLGDAVAGCLADADVARVGACLVGAPALDEVRRRVPDPVRAALFRAFPLGGDAAVRPTEEER